jgi:hypothetical protein
MRDAENKLDEKLSLLTFGRNTPDFVPILRHQLVALPKQWVVASPELAVCLFLDSYGAIVARK